MIPVAIPHLCCRDAAGAVEFYKKAFGAVETMRYEEGGKVGHSELNIQGAVVYLADEYPDYNFLSPQTVGGTGMVVSLLIADVDELTRRAEAAGAKVEREPRDEFYGQRTSTLLDPYGHRWTLRTPLQEKHYGARKGFHAVTPYLIFEKGVEAMEWYGKALGAVEIGRHLDGAGRLVHGEISVGDSPVMICEECAEYPGQKSPKRYGGSPAQLFLYTKDPDGVAARAVEHGAKVVLPVEDRPYGRGGGVEDPFGYTWWINDHKE
jgi:PhnB protein